VGVASNITHERIPGDDRGTCTYSQTQGLPVVGFRPPTPRIFARVEIVTGLAAERRHLLAQRVSAGKRNVLGVSRGAATSRLARSREVPPLRGSVPISVSVPSADALGYRDAAAPRLTSANRRAAATTIGLALTSFLRRESTFKFSPSSARAPSNWRSPLLRKHDFVHRFRFADFEHGVTNRAGNDGTVRHLKLKVLLARFDSDLRQYCAIDPCRFRARIDHHSRNDGRLRVSSVDDSAADIKESHPRNDNSAHQGRGMIGDGRFHL